MEDREQRQRPIYISAKEAVHVASAYRKKVLHWQPVNPKAAADDSCGLQDLSRVGLEQGGAKDI